MKTIKNINIIFIIIWLVLISIVVHKTIKWEDKNCTWEDNWQDYELLILDDNEVMLYKSDLSDSIHLKLINAYVLEAEEVIQVNHPIKRLP